MEKKKSSWLRELLWPIYGDENWKFIPMVLMLALCLFNYTSLRITKDALIVTAPNSGAGVLNFLKGYVVMPMSILFVLFYAKISNIVSKKNLFYVTLLPFLGFFIAFGTVLYPFTDIIHMSTERMLEIQETYPRLRYIVPIFGYWSYSAFYVFSELWGNVSISLLFWQFANLNTSKTEVKRFYPLFAAYSNIGLIAAGLIQSNDITTELTCALVIISGLLLAGVYWWLTKYILKEAPEVKTTSKEKKPKPSLKESFKMIMSSKYLGYIAIIVLAYGMTANLVEVTWKAKVKEMYASKSEYKIFMGNFFVATGFITMFVGLFLKNVVTRFGWLTAAMVTPIMLLVTSLGFFGFALFSDMLLSAAVLATSLPLLISVIVGAVQNIASKSTKYALFDPTTQMTYIPLSDEERVKGKAAVDVIGGRLGKSLGGHIQSVALLLTGSTQLGIAPILMVFLIVVVAFWIFSLTKLSKEYEDKLKQKTDN